MSDRIRLIDTLRGLSLAGIAMVHFGEQYLGFMPPPGEPYNIHGTADKVLEALSWIFVRGKGFGVFSFLFGLSFVLQMQRAERRRPGADFRPRFAWRLLILFAIGWLHGLAYSGDILNVYAALGIPLVLFYRVPDRWILALAVLLLVGVPRIAQRVVHGPAAPGELQSLQARMNAQAEEHWQALTEGDVPAIVRFHATAGFRAKWEFQHGFMGRGYQTFGLFLLGLWAGRRRVFEDVAAHRRLLVRLWRWTGALTLLVPVLAGLLFAAGQAARGGQPPPAAGTLPDFSSWPLVGGMSLFDTWNNAMTLFYVASFTLLFPRPRWQRLFLRFGPVGRMALSVYVGQTVVGVLVFFGFGFGLLGRFGNSVTIPIGLAVFVVEAWASGAWLRHFRFGPLEWAWRSLTWLRREPFRGPA
ncbi:MAG TPA: DUF418 domain-containing protein [Vicinamibacteria bacterium]|nr:DUF418 domain-containing protein [Vicinamibacteria bacterium]